MAVVLFAGVAFAQSHVAGSRPELAGIIAPGYVDDSKDDTHKVHVTVPPADVTVLGHFGPMQFPAAKLGGVVLGASGLFRRGVLAVGGYTELGGGPMSMYAAAASAGFSMRTDGGWRGDLLAASGIRHFSGWGTSLRLFNSDPGASATLPFAGGSFRLTHVHDLSQRDHLVVGGLVEVDRDLWQVRRSYDYGNDGEWFSSHGHAEHLVGGTRWVVAITFGGTLDLFAQR